MSENRQVYHVYRTQFVEVGLATPVIAVITAGIRPARSKCREINEVHLTISVKVTGNESNFDISGSITVSAWIKVNKFDKDWQTIIAKGDTAWRLSRGEVAAIHAGERLQASMPKPVWGWAGEIQASGAPDDFSMSFDTLFYPQLLGR